MQRVGRVAVIVLVALALIGVGLVVNFSVPAAPSPLLSRPASPGFDLGFDEIGFGGDDFAEVPGPERIVEAPPIAPGIPPSPVAFQLQDQDVRLEIFSAGISLEVENVRMVLDQITEIADGFDGVVAESSTSIINDREFGSISIRVPRNSFAQAIILIEDLGDLQDKQTRTDDVTEEYVDLNARLENLDRQEERLQEILDLANDVQDVLDVERQLERVRGEIERLTGRINFLERSSAMSTISVSLIEPRTTPLPEIDWLEPFTTGISFLFGAFRGIVLIAFAAIPFILILVPVYLIFRRRTGKKKVVESVA